MSYMKEVAKMLGVEMDRDFKCVGMDGNFRITESRVTYNGVWSADSLMFLLSGDLEVAQVPWKPKYEEKYWSIGPGGVLEPGTWLNDFIDIAMYRLGNCYRTSQEAEFNRDKWISFYASDEALEV